MHRTSPTGSEENDGPHNRRKQQRTSTEVCMSISVQCMALCVCILELCFSYPCMEGSSFL